MSFKLYLKVTMSQLTSAYIVVEVLIKYKTGKKAMEMVGMELDNHI